MLVVAHNTFSALNEPQAIVGHWGWHKTITPPPTGQYCLRDLTS